MIERLKDAVLTLTDKAVNVIETLTSRPGLPKRGGLRIAARTAQDEGNQGGLALSLAQGPPPETR